MRLSLEYIIILVLILCCIIPYTTYSQDIDYEGLFAKWQDSTRSDEARLTSFYTLLNNHNEYSKGPPPGEYMTVWYDEIDKALALEREVNNLEYQYVFLSYRLIYDVIVKGLDSTTICARFEELLDISTVSIDPKPTLSVLSLLFQFGPACEFEDYSLNELRELLEKESIKLQDELNESKLIRSETEKNILTDLIALHLSIGNAYKSQAEYPSALKHFLIALNLGEEFQLLTENLVYGIESMGIMHTDIGNYVEAEHYFLKEIKIADSLDYTQLKGSGNTELSKLYLKLDKPEEALEKATVAISIMAPEADSDAACNLCVHEAYTAQAGTYNVMGNHAVALKKLMDISTHFENPNSGATPYARAFYYTEVATAQLGLKNYDKARAAAAKSLSYKSGRTYNDRKRAYEIIYQCEKAIGNFQKSLIAYEKQVDLEKSMTALRNAQEVTRLQLESSFKQTQLEGELAFQTELSKQKATKNLLMALGIVVLIIAMGLFYRLRFIRKTQKVLQNKNSIIEAEKQKALTSERAKHQFLANMSHEIRTPMNAIKGMTDILIRRDPKENQAEYLKGIKQSSDSLLYIINDILDLSKIEAGKIELEQQPFSINELIHNVHTIMHFKSEEKGLELIKHLPAKEIVVKGDSTRLRQILINLIGNAIKFTEKGMVTTTLAHEPAGEKLQLHFTVSDTGIGIDQNGIDKIFNSFEQAYSDTSRKYGGTGLGLSISKKLVELHDGKIWVESQKGKGSQFHFVISYDKAVLQHSDVLRTVAQNTIADKLSGINILLVEDNQFNAVVAQEELEDAIESVNIDLAANGAIAVEMVKSGDYEVVLMDVQMPKMNGYEATKAIRGFDNNKAQLPIIAMTANVLKEEVDACYQAGMNDFIGKPFDTNELITKIYDLRFSSQS